MRAAVEVTENKEGDNVEDKKKGKTVCTSVRSKTYVSDCTPVLHRAPVLETSLH